MNYTELFVERHRPKTLKDIILSKENREFFENIAKQDIKTIPHMLFVGPPGCGKTTMSKIIVNDILKCQYLYINASDQSGVEVVRSLIKNFIETKSIDGNMKVVILDEFEGMSGNSGTGSSAQGALRNMIEEYTPYVRFIFTTNYIHKIIEPILSRVQTFYFSLEYNDYIKQCITVVKNEHIKVLESQKNNFLKLVKTCYPDLRKILNNIQKFTTNNEFIYFEKDLTQEISSVASVIIDMLLIKNTIFEIRKYVIDNEKIFNSDYHALLKTFFELVYKFKDFDIIKKKQVLLIVSEAMLNDRTVLDKEINFCSTIIKIDGIL